MGATSAWHLIDRGASLRKPRVLGSRDVAHERFRASFHRIVDLIARAR